jgi:glycerophosphoryl diester phosphodiesterase
MKGIIDTWYDIYAYGLLSRVLLTGFLYDLMYKAVGAILLAPLAALVLQQLIEASGSVSVSNESISAFLLSAPGAAFVLLATALALTGFYAEQAGLMHIAAGASRAKLTRGRDALITALRAMPRLLHLALWQVGILLLWLLPLAVIAAVTYTTLLGAHDINWYLAQRPPEFQAALIIGAALAVTAVGVLSYFGTTWGLSIPLCLYEDARGRDALRRSRELTRGRRWRSFRLVVVNLFLALAASALVLWLADAGIGVLLRSIDGIRALVVMTAAAVVVLAILAAVTSFVVMAVLAASIMHLYLTQMERDGLPDEHWHRAAYSIRIPYWAIAGVLIALLAGAVAVADNTLADLKLGREAQITAHRGSSADAPENTLSAIYQAFSDRADYAEIDVQETADGELVLLHDTDLMRIAGIPVNIWDAKLPDLRRVDVGGWFGPEFAMERIPTLAEAIKATGGRLGLNVEIKYNGHDVRLAERVVQTLRSEGCVERCFITSLSQDGLARVRELAPEIRIGLIVTAALGDTRRMDVDLLSMNQAHVSPAVIHRNRRAGIETHVWTVNDEVSMSRMLDFGVDNIITDHPALLRRVIDERAKLTNPSTAVAGAGPQASRVMPNDQRDPAE